MTVELIKAVRFGLLIGFFGLVFGIGWAFWLVLGHEGIHQSLEERAAVAAGKNVREDTGPADVRSQTGAPSTQQGHSHKGGARGHGVPESGAEAMGHEGVSPHFTGAHDNPVIELSHIRLTRGHLHAMGLGLVTLAVSLTLAFTTAGGIIKTSVSTLTGIGRLIYPFAWIVMGYRTPSLGPEAAEASVLYIAGPGVALVAFGVLIAAFFVARDILRGQGRFLK